MFLLGTISTIIGVAYFVILARPLSDTEKGVYAILTFILALVQVFGTFALPSASTKYIAQYLAEEKPDKAKSVVARILQISLLTSVILGALLFVSAEWLSTMLLGTPIWAPLFRILTFTSIFTILQLQILSFLRGLQRIREMAVVSLTYTIVEKGLAIFLLVYLQWGLYSVVFGWLTGLIISSIAGLILTSRFLGVLERPHPVKPLIRFSYPLYISGFLSFAANWVDQLFILPYMGSGPLGIYHWSLRAAVVPGLLSSSIVAALFPQLSELRTRYGAEGLRRAFHISTRYVVLVGFPMIIGLAALAYPVAVLFALGTEAALPLTVLCLAVLPRALGVAISPTLMTLERTKTVLKIIVASILCNMAVSYITLAFLNLHMLGPACARFFASFVSFGLGVYALRKLLKVTFDKEMLWKVSVASIVMALAVVPLEMFIFHLYMLPIYVIVGAVVYFFSLVTLRAIKKQDVELIRDYLPRRLKRVASWLGRLTLVE